MSFSYQFSISSAALTGAMPAWACLMTSSTEAAQASRIGPGLHAIIDGQDHQRREDQNFALVHDPEWWPERGFSILPNTTRANSHSA
jgi:hypothetical protein